MAEMYQLRMATTHVNRNMTRFAVEALRDAASQINEGKGRPILLAHDAARPIGWITHASVVMLEDSEHALDAEGWLAETPEEIANLRRLHEAYLLGLQATEVTECGCQPTLGGTLYSDHGCMVERREQIVTEAYPELAEHTDDDGLLVLGAGRVLSDGAIIYREHILLPHRFLRRAASMLNTLNLQFLSKLSLMTGVGGVERVAIRIDEHALGLKGTQRCYEEADYWWGPRYSGGLGSTPAGMVTHGADERTRSLMGLDRTEFFAYDRDGLRSMEIEEVHERPVLVEWNGTHHAAERYLHVNVNSSTSRVTHIDGAVRLYDLDGWRQRTTSKLDQVRKGQGYLKLFRVDGDLSQERALELAHFYYRNNPLIAERFCLDEANP